MEGKPNDVAYKAMGSGGVGEKQVRFQERMQGKKDFRNYQRNLAGEEGTNTHTLGEPKTTLERRMLGKEDG